MPCFVNASPLCKRSLHGYDDPGFHVPRTFSMSLPVLRGPSTRFRQNPVIALYTGRLRTRIHKDSMMNSDDTRTSSTLLRRTADWRDQDAWREFVARYEPYLRTWCREYRLDDEFAADVSQIFWLELAEKMRSFQYDPSRRFRGWIRRCFHWRVVDAIRERRREEGTVRALDDPSLARIEDSPLSREPLYEDNEPSSEQLILLSAHLALTIS